MATTPSRTSHPTDFAPRVHVRAIGVPLSPEDRDYVHRRIATRLRKHQKQIERVSARFEDVNGPRGGSDQLCRLKVVLRARDSVHVEQSDHDLRAAVDGGTNRLERTVRRALQAERRKTRGRATLRPARPRAGQGRRSRQGRKARRRRSA